MNRRSIPALLKKITARILAEVPGICCVCYDLTPRPIGTIEKFGNSIPKFDCIIFT